MNAMLKVITSTKGITTYDPLWRQNSVGAGKRYGKNS